jgi:CTP:molybdopterin cytidylyltransferase MocA
VGLGGGGGGGAPRGGGGGGGGGAGPPGSAHSLFDTIPALRPGRTTKREWADPDPIRVPNPRWEEGPFVSILLGLEALGGDAPVLIVPVDCPVPPGVPGELLRAVAPGQAWVAPAWGGRRGHPVLLTATGRRWALDADADATLRDLLDATPGTTVAVTSPLVRCNLNTPSDRDRFLAEHPGWPDLPPGGAP